MQPTYPPILQQNKINNTLSNFSRVIIVTSRLSTLSLEQTLQLKQAPPPLFYTFFPQFRLETASDVRKRDKFRTKYTKETAKLSGFECPKSGPPSDTETPLQNNNVSTFAELGINATTINGIFITNSH
jgi:hypothetical protein